MEQLSNFWALKNHNFPPRRARDLKPTPIGQDFGGSKLNQFCSAINNHK